MSSSSSLSAPHDVVPTRSRRLSPVRIEWADPHPTDHVGLQEGEPVSDRVVYCHRCGSCDDRRLYAPLRDGHTCASCWRALGRPFPRAEAAPQAVHEQELRTRERMQARGGPDKYLVRAGRS